MTTNALVFVLSRYFDSDGPRCVEYCTAQGYHIAAVVRDDWAGAMKAVCAGVASVVVVADKEHLDETCTPRMEVAADRPAVEGPRGRRTHMLRRNAAR